MDRPTCRICGTTESLLRCAKCKTVYYCSTSHQHIDWPNHKLECRHLAKLKLHQQQQQQQQLQLQQQQQQQQQQQNNNKLCQPQIGGGVAIDIGSSNHMMEVGAGYNDWGGLFNGDTLNGSDMDIFSSGEGSQGNFADITAGEANILAGVNTISLVLGTNEAEIMNSQAESVSHSQHSNVLFNNTITTTSGVGGGDVSGLSFGVTSGSGANSGGGSGSDNSSAYRIGRGDENYILQPNMGGITNERNEELCRNIINDMNTYGLSVVDDFLGLEKGLRILNEVHGMYAAGVFKDGQLVSSNQMAEQDLRTIRGDKITWVTGVEPNCANVGYLINQVDAVITRANTMKNNGKLGNYTIRERTKAMVACYPGSGAHYVMHVDNPNRDGRVITAIYYLNVNWDTMRSGGVLRIFPEHGGSIAEIEPKFDRLIFFWSDKRNPHEVQPAHRTRYAITVWYFDADEREAALNRCKQYRNKTNSNNKQTTTNNANNTIAPTETTTKSINTTNSTTTTNSNTSNTNPNSNSSDICT